MARRNAVTGNERGDDSDRRKGSDSQPSHPDSLNDSDIAIGAESIDQASSTPPTGRVQASVEGDSFQGTLMEGSVDRAAELIDSGAKNWPLDVSAETVFGSETDSGLEGLTEEAETPVQPVKSEPVEVAKDHQAPEQIALDYTQTLSHRTLEEDDLASLNDVLAEVRADIGISSAGLTGPDSERIENTHIPHQSQKSTDDSKGKSEDYLDLEGLSEEGAAEEGHSETQIESHDIDISTFSEHESSLSVEKEIPLEERLQIRPRAIEGGPPFGTASEPEYSVISKLTEGGMGAVYVARQTSLDRKLAIKTLKPMKPTQEQRLEASGRLVETLRQRRKMFLTEAAVTANLVHPNIISIHDLGETSKGIPYYSMKLVNGTAWNDGIRGQTLGQNIDVLLSVADAVAYAHHRGVINRDLKPENVILGEYGEVVVLDWGLASSLAGAKGAFSTATSDSTTLGQGTPVYMAPEMLLGPPEEVGEWSDIYLLGAILFEIITGGPPHKFEELDGLAAFHRQFTTIVGKNVIREVNESGELMDIARRAMRTNRHERYASVLEFQDAIRTALRHRESERLTERAVGMLDGEPGYSEYQNAIALLEEAVREWSENQPAQEKLTQARLDCGEQALLKGDHDFGLQLTNVEETDKLISDKKKNEFAALQKKLQRAKQRRAQTRKTIMALLLVLLVGGSTASAWIYNTNMNLVAAYGDVKQAEAKKLAAERDAAKADEKAKTAVETANTEAAKVIAVAEMAVDDAEVKVAVAIKAADEAEVTAATAKKDTEAAEKAAGEAEIKTAAAEKAAGEAEVKTAAAVKAAGEAEVKATAAKKDAGEAEVKATAAKKDADKKIADAEKMVTDAKAEVVVAEEKRKRVEADAEVARMEATEARAEGLYRSIDGQSAGFERSGEYSRAIPLLEKILKLKLSDRRRKIIDGRLRHVLKEARRTAGPIQTGAVSRDGKTFVYADNQGNVQVHRVAVGGEDIADPLATFKVNGAVNAVLVSPDGTWAAAAVSDKRTNERTVQIWNVSSGVTDAPRTLSGFAGDVTALTTARGGDWLVTGDQKGNLRIYRAETGSEPLEEYRTGSRPIVDVKVLPDGSGLIFLVAAECYLLAIEFDEDADGTVSNIKLVPRGQLSLPTEERAAFSRVAISGDGQKLALAQENRVILLQRDTESGEDEFPFVHPNSRPLNEWLLRAHGENVNDLGFSEDGKQLVTASDDFLVNVWNLETPTTDAPAKLVKRLRGHGGTVQACGFLAGSGRLVSMSKDSFVRYWDLSTYEASRQELERLLRSDLDDSAAAKGKQETTLRLVDPSAPRTSDIARSLPLPQPRIPFNSVFRLASFQNSDRSSEDSSPTDSPASEVPERIVLNRHRGPVKSARFSRDGQKLITGGVDRLARVWNARDGQPLKGPDGLSAAFQTDPSMSEGHRLNGAQLLYLPGRAGLLLTTGYDSTISIWDASIDQPGAGHQVTQLRDVGLLNTFAASSDGELLMTSASPNEARLWRIDTILNVANPEPVHKFSGIDEKPVSALAISPGKTRFAAGTRGGTLAIWNGSTKEPAFIRRQAHSRSTVSAVEFIDDSHLLTAGIDGQVILWKLSEEENELQVTIKRTYEHGQGATIGAATQLVLSPNHEQFLTVTYPPQRAGTEQKLHLWSVAETAAVRRIPLKKLSAGPEAVKGITSVTWSSNGSRAAVVADGVLSLFETNEWKLITRLTDPTGRAIPTGVAFPTDQAEPKNIATFDGYKAHVWNIQGGTHVVSFRPHATVLAADFSADGKFVVTGSRSLRIFNGDHTGNDYGKSLFKLEQPHPGPVSTAVFAPGGNFYRFVSASRAGSAKVWDWSPADNRLLLVRELAGHEGGVSHAAWSPDGKQVLTVGDDGRPRLWTVDAAVAPLVLEIKDFKQYDLLCCAISSDGERIAVGGLNPLTEESVAWVWKKVATGYVPHCSAGRKHNLGGITAMTFIPGTNLLLTGGQDDEVILSFLPTPVPGVKWLEVTDTDSLVGDGRQKAHRGPITAISADSSGRVVTSSDDGEVIIWSKFETFVKNPK